MQIQRVHNHNYNTRGSKLLKKYFRSGLKEPLEAITAETVELTGHQTKDDYGWLIQYVKNLPDDVVKERMTKHKDSFPTIEDAITDALIIEEI